MELRYQVDKDISAIREDLERQKSLIEDRIDRIDKKEVSDQLVGALSKIKDVSTALIPIQQSLNLIWKRTQQIEEDLKRLISKHQ